MLFLLLGTDTIVYILNWHIHALGGFLHSHPFCQKAQADGLHGLAYLYYMVVRVIKTHCPLSPRMFLCGVDQLDLRQGLQFSQKTVKIIFLKIKF